MEAAAKNGTPVVELTPGQSFTGRYACARKDRLTAKNGSAYLALELRDRTGSIPARIFRDSDRIGINFERGDVVAVKGRVEQFRGQLSAEIEDAKRSTRRRSTRPTFCQPPTATGKNSKAFSNTSPGKSITPATGRWSRTCCSPAKPPKPSGSPCTRAGHHAYIGGLSEHTVAVGTLVTETCVLHPKLNSDLLMAAALIHDIGKTGEFTYGAEIGLSERGRNLGHLQIGAELVGEAADRAGLDQAERDALLSTVMCHHGTDPLRLRQFPSAEAIALYRLNALDAQVKTALEHGLT